MGTAVIIPPTITPEENEIRKREIERVLSNIFKCDITVSFMKKELKAQ